jgi:hypothetical protein
MIHIGAIREVGLAFLLMGDIKPQTHQRFVFGGKLSMLGIYQK